MRLIDGDALLGWFDGDGMETKSMVRQLIQNAPTIATAPTPPQPVDGDAISRAAVLRNLEATEITFDIERDAKSQLMQDIRIVQNAPAIPSPRYGVDDVVKGVTWVDDGGLEHPILSINRVNSVEVGWTVGHRGERWFSKKAVAAMLNAADTVSFPEGHPRNPTPEPPTLLEAAKGLRDCVETPGEHEAMMELFRAIARAEAGAEGEK